MKKSLLFASMVTAFAASASAISSPQVYENYGFAGFSPDGKIAVSTVYEEINILFVETGQVYSYSSDDEYALGGSAKVSNTGVIVGQYGGMLACYWENGKWTLLEDSKMSIAHGVTVDGQRIFGAIQPDSYLGDSEGQMLQPCYWQRQSDGSYGEPILLPFPALDLTGRIPQYITALCGSSDGKVIAGQITDFGGFICQPIIYTQGADGEWSYTLVQNELFHPEGFVMPEDPGEGPNIQPETFMSQEEIAAYEEAVQKYYEFQDSLVYPDIFLYMTPAEYTAYQAALDAYYEDWENNPYPDEQDFMTEEEWDAYQAAIVDYYEQINSNQYPEFQDFMTEEELEKYYAAKQEEYIWDEKWAIFSQAYNQLCEEVPSFVFNNAMINSDGSKYYTTFTHEEFDEQTFEFVNVDYPWVFNLADNEYDSFKSDVDLILTSVTENGTMLAQKPASWVDPIAAAYILPAGEESFMSLYDYYVQNNPEVASWMKSNLTHQYVDYVLNEETWNYDEVLVEAMFTGIPFTNSDLSVISLAVENFWDFDNGVAVFGYLLPSVAEAGVNLIGEDKAEVKALRGAVLSFSGDFDSVSLYDVEGHKVFSVTNPSGKIETGLSKGVYVMKAKTSEGNVINTKVLF